MPYKYINYCCDCGVEMETFIGEEVDQETAELAKQIKVILCDGCFEIRQRKDTAALNRRAHLARVQASNIPAEIIAWDPAIGNNTLKKQILDYRNYWLWIAGPSGICKTRAVCAVADRMLADPAEPVIYYYRAVDLAERVTAEFTGRQKSAAAFKTELCRADLLIIDDLGKEKLTERGAEFLYSVIDARYISGRRLWITTNVNGQELETRLGEPVLRRLREKCYQIGDIEPVADQPELRV
jgi:DNA replication protein DnaC